MTASLTTVMYWQSLPFLIARVREPCEPHLLAVGLQRYQNLFTRHLKQITFLNTFTEFRAIEDVVAVVEDLAGEGAATATMQSCLAVLLVNYLKV